MMHMAFYLAVCLLNTVFSDITASFLLPDITGHVWKKVGYLNMSDPTQQCPHSWQTVTSPVASCEKKGSANIPCDSMNITTGGARYQMVCGRFSGYQVGTPDAFSGVAGLGWSLETYYVDGVSITYGSPGNRHHVYTYAAGVTEFFGSPACPCAGGTSPPSFVGSDYYCESGNPHPTVDGTIFYAADVVWDGLLCRHDEVTCCDPPNLPWFCQTLPTPITENLEVRICLDESSENVALKFFELYILDATMSTNSSTTSPIGATTSTNSLSTSSIDATRSTNSLSTSSIDATRSTNSLTTSPMDAARSTNSLSTSSIDATRSTNSLSTSSIDATRSTNSLTTSPMDAARSTNSLSTSSIDATRSTNSLTTSPMDATTSNNSLSTSSIVGIATGVLFFALAVIILMIILTLFAVHHKIRKDTLRRYVRLDAATNTSPEHSSSLGLVETKELTEEYYRNQFVNDLAIKQLHLYKKPYGSDSIHSIEDSEGPPLTADIEN